MFGRTTLHPLIWCSASVAFGIDAHRARGEHLSERKKAVMGRSDGAMRALHLMLWIAFRLLSTMARSHVVVVVLVK